MQTKTDFLGNEYGPGDYVIYAQVSDRSANMIKAQVLEIKENGRVKVQPLAGSRWKGHSARSYYVDKRTDDRIKPSLDTGLHYKASPYYLNSATGEKISYEEYVALNWFDRGRGKYRYVGGVLEDYVELRYDPVKPVTLTVTENIVKFADGELPTEG